jgi:hypothetical protein
MASKLYFHGHPINRREARSELHLKVMERPPLELEGAMWRLYKDLRGGIQQPECLQPAGRTGSRTSTTPATCPARSSPAPNSSTAPGVQSAACHCRERATVLQADLTTALHASYLSYSDGCSTGGSTRRPVANLGAHDGSVNGIIMPGAARVIW